MPLCVRPRRCRVRRGCGRKPENRDGALSGEVDELREAVGKELQASLVAIVHHMRDLVGFLKENSDWIVNLARPNLPARRYRGVRHQEDHGHHNGARGTCRRLDAEPHRAAHHRRSGRRRDHLPTKPRATRRPASSVATKTSAARVSRRISSAGSSSPKT